MVHLQQELQFKERGFQTLKKIDKKMSDAQGSYKLDEAQAVLRETKAIKKAITCGEKEKQDLIKSLAMLKDGFRTDRGSHSDLWSSSSSLESSGFPVPKQYLDMSSQTDISGSVSMQRAPWGASLVEGAGMGGHLPVTHPRSWLVGLCGAGCQLSLWSSVFL